MTTLELGTLESERRRFSGILSLVRHLWAAGREWHLRRIGLQRIAQMPEHLLRDIGVVSDDGKQADPVAALWNRAHLPPNVR